MMGAGAVTTLLLIRHGETAWNAEHRIQGRLDVPLSTTGMWQAGRLAERLAGEPLDAVVSSDLARAWMTAVPLAEAHGLGVVAEPRLRERVFGIFEGRTLDEIAARHPEEFAAWRARDVDWRMPGGESGAELIARVLEAVREIAEAHVGSTVAVVTHGGVLDVVYRSARALAWDAPREHLMLNAGINRLQADSEPLRLRIVGWADVAHLDQSRDELAAP
ncbi:MAG: histidine phosphatase family protein [Burkholderiaceae bacterium]|jgi:probable phosphoglycerate mutase|nr:histidine phosphatase family protein [Burkholderiaceae bacterium]